MIITQDDLVKDISEKENIDLATVRKVFKSAEDIVFLYLSSTEPAENISLKIFNGLNVNRKYVGEKVYSKGMFKNLNSSEHVNISANITKYYKNRVNDNLFVR